MNRAGILLVLAALGAGCSDTTDTPGALLRGPGALAVFDGVVKHESGSQRKYLAIANTRGDELRLVDLTDNEVVSSPGLAFPLSIPVEGWPMWVAAAELGDGDKPDALVVVASGSDVVELVDTWSGQPTVLDFPVVEGVPESGPVTLPAGAQVLSIAAVRPHVESVEVPGSPGTYVDVQVGRILLGLTGGRLGVLDLVRDPADLLGTAIARPTLTVLEGLDFDPVSLSQNVATGLVYAASRTTVEGTLGLAEITLPDVLSTWDAAAAVTPLDAGLATQAVAAVRFAAWDAATDTFGAAVDRVLAVPAPGGCWEGSISCLVAVDPDTKTLAANRPELVASEGPFLLPLRVPGLVSGLLALGRSDGSIVIESGSGERTTSGMAVVSSTDGAVYLADVARWALSSETSALTGAARAGVGAASTVLAPEATAPNALGLWSLGVTGVTPALSVNAADFPARIRVTPGFTPDDDWTLTWQGVIPALASVEATLDMTSRSLSFSDANLLVLGVQSGDRVVIDPVLGCASPTTLAVTASPSVTVGPPLVSTVTVEPVPPATWDDVDLCVEGLPDGTGVVATLRYGAFTLAGGDFGLAGRIPAYRPSSTPTPFDVASVEFKFGAGRIFHVMDACVAGSDCAANWRVAPYVDVPDFPMGPTDWVENALDFPNPAGPTVGLLPGWVGTAEPPPGGAIQFTTRSGAPIPSPRRPLIDGSAVASALPSGLALWDRGAEGLQVQASYTAGLVMIFDPAAAITSMSVIH